MIKIFILAIWYTIKHPTSFNSTLSKDNTLTYNQVMGLSDKDNWNAALVKERNNMVDYELGCH
jgi:hypothetical protein